MENDQIRDIAEKIAQVIANQSENGDLGALSQSIKELGQRIDRLEAAIPQGPGIENPSFHPSLDRFEIAEAIVDRLFDKSSVEKACTFEPSKPCDHCSMCSSRGF
ncbi:hypothetical protein BH20ACI2_BH20ACI2_05970 [soil metagenome]